METEEQTCVGLSQYVVGTVLAANNLYTKLSVSHPVSHVKYILLQIPKRHTNTCQMSHIRSILKIYTVSIRHSCIKPIKQLEQSKTLIQLLFEAKHRCSLRKLIQSRGQLTEYQAKYFLNEIQFVLRYIGSKELILQYFSCEDISVDDCIRIEFEFMLHLRLKSEKRSSAMRRIDRTIVSHRFCPQLLDQDCQQSVVDAWNIGLCLYEMLEGRQLFMAPNATFHDESLVSDQAFRYIPRDSHCRDIIKRLLHPNPKQRMTLSQLFKHRWMMDGRSIAQILPKTVVFCPPSEQFKDNQEKIQKCYANKQSLDCLLKGDGVASIRASELCQMSENRIGIQDLCGSLVKTTNNLSGIEWAEEEEDELVYVQDFSDISTVFGYGYRMSNGRNGFYFNDRTLLLQHPSEKMLYFFDEGWDMQYFRDEKVPEEHDLRKKYYILSAYVKNSDALDNLSKTTQQHSLTYIKQYIRTKHAQMFLLSNDAVQCKFTDKTQVIAVKDKSYSYERKQNEFKLIQSDATVEVLMREKYTRQLGCNLFGDALSWNDGGHDENMQGAI